MKKFIFILSLSTILGCSIFFKPCKNEFSLTSYFNSGTLYTYTNKSINSSSVKITNNYINLDSQGAKKEDIVGESIYFKNLEVGSVLETMKAKVIFIEYLENENLTIIYTLSPLIPVKKKVKNNYINFQIAISNEYTIIGWPTILGSF